MIEALQNIDASLMLWLNGFHNNFFDVFMFTVSNKLVWIPLDISIFAVIVMRYGIKPKLLYILALFGICFACSDYVCASVIRPIFCRPRPANADSPIYALVHIVNNDRGGSYGFPSCHAANSFMLAALVSLVFRRRYLTIFMYIWAVIHSYSRIYLGLHYPGDILTGALLGTAISFTFYYIIKRFISYDSEKKTFYPYTIIYTGIAIFLILIVISCIFDIDFLSKTAMFR